MCAFGEDDELARAHFVDNGGVLISNTLPDQTFGFAPESLQPPGTIVEPLPTVPMPLTPDTTAPMSTRPAGWGRGQPISSPIPSETPSRSRGPGIMGSPTACSALFGDAADSPAAGTVRFLDIDTPPAAHMHASVTPVSGHPERGVVNATYIQGHSAPGTPFGHSGTIAHARGCDARQTTQPSICPSSPADVFSLNFVVHASALNDPLGPTPLPDAIMP